MDIRSRRALKAAAAEALTAAPFDPRRLALLHTGAALALSLILTVLNFILTRRIGDTGGLAGMGIRSVLSTAQNVLILLPIAVTPFWEAGFFRAGIRMARKENASPETLLEGFRRFGPVLRLALLKTALTVVVGILSMNISSGIFLLTPLSNGLAQALEPMLTAQEFVVDDAFMQALIPTMTPMLILMGIVFCALMLPIVYRFRMAEFAIMDERGVGALQALGISNRLMRDNRMALFRLDLSFWWFYGLQFLFTAVGYGEEILALMGISLPVSPDVAFFGFYILYLVCQLLLAWRAGSIVQTAYATAYDALREEAAEKPAPLVRQFPWDLLPQ